MGETHNENDGNIRKRTRKPPHRKKTTNYVLLYVYYIFLTNNIIFFGAGTLGVLQFFYNFYVGKKAINLSELTDFVSCSLFFFFINGFPFFM